MEDTTDLKINIEEEMRQSYMDYAMSVIVGRALPDVRDGLKPVQRRILYAMLGRGLLSNRQTSKCARVVGEVLGRLHPHGDVSVYDALVKLAQPWNQRHPLVDGQGNFGSIDGDSAAAYRYTECRMTALAEQLLRDIDQETVDFIPNFDESDSEPVVLPAVWPNLLVNGADGIAVGMATHIPPHNLTEVISATMALIEDPELSADQLMNDYIPGPDFPTGGIVYGLNAIRSAYNTGRGIVKIAGRTHVENIQRKSKEVEAVIITEIPYQVNKTRLIEKIAALVNDRAIEGISTIRDESDRKGMRIVIELKRDATPDIVLNQLLKMTPLRVSFGIINLAIVEGKPEVCSLPQLLQNFIDHRRDVVTRRTQFQLRKAKARMHILEGYLTALANLDDVVQLIKQSDTPKDARDGLMAKYELSEIQAQAILDLRLQKLTGMERLAIEKEAEELAKEIERLQGILDDPKKVDAVIVSELGEIKDKFGEDRRTDIASAGSAELELEDLIEDEEMVVTVSHSGYVKRTSVREYGAQKRGGKGKKGAAASDEDFIEHLFVASTKSHLMVFTTMGQVYRLRVHQIPEAGRAARGRALVNLLKLRKDEKLKAVLAIKEFSEDSYLVTATKQGQVKKSELAAYSNIRQKGLIGCGLRKDDELIGVAVVREGDNIVLGTKSGMAIRFDEGDIRCSGRGATGVKGINISDDDEVVGMAIVSKDGEPASEGEHLVTEEGTLCSVCENGYGKRTLLSEYRPQSRGGKGLIDIKTTERNGQVAGICAVSDGCSVMVITSSGKIIRFNIAGVSPIGRNCQGVKLVDLEPGETVAAVCRTAEDLETEEENGEQEA